MALNENTWGAAVAAAITPLVPAAGTPISAPQIQAIWVAICGAHKTHISGNAVATTAGVTAGVATVTGTVS